MSTTKATTAPRDLTAVRYVSLVAGTLGAMYGEWTLATQTGMAGFAAVSYPLCLDLYSYAAFRSGKRGDVMLSLGLMAVSQALSHLISAHVIHAGWPVILIVWACILPTVLWRVHHLGTTPRQTEAAAPVTEAAPVDTHPAGPGTPKATATATADELAPRREARTRATWRKSEALAYVAERAHMDAAELAALMGYRGKRRVNQLRAELAAA